MAEEDTKEVREMRVEEVLANVSHLFSEYLCNKMESRERDSKMRSVSLVVEQESIGGCRVAIEFLWERKNSGIDGDEEQEE